MRRAVRSPVPAGKPRCIHSPPVPRADSRQNFLGRPWRVDRIAISMRLLTLILGVLMLTAGFSAAHAAGQQTNSGGVAIPEDPQWEADKAHLRQIFKAIQAYRREHQNQLPEWLSDLVPRYLSDTNVLMSIAEIETGAVGSTRTNDPKLHSSYQYEFSTAPAARFAGSNEVGKLTMREWRSRQMKLFGLTAPLVRLVKGDVALNLTCAGDLYESRSYWETDPQTLARVKDARSAGRFRSEWPPVSLPLLVCEAEKEKPVAKATVRVEMWTGGKVPREETVATDNRGTCRISLPDEPVRELILSIRKPGYLGERYHYDETTLLPSLLVCRLSPAVGVGGVVEDSANRPIVGAQVDLLGLGSTTTDSEGRWFFDGAPRGFQQLTLEISHPDFRSAEIQCRTTNVVATLHRRVVVTGVVKDATTGAWIENFAICGGVDLDRGVEWDPGLVFQGRQGSFTLSFEQRSPNYLRVQANGYLPATSSHIGVEQGELKLEFKMRPATPRVARVISSDGQPVFGAQVMTLNESSTAVLNRGCLRAEQAITRTDELGRFVYLVTPEVCTVVAVATNGFAEAPIETLTATQQVSLQPWSRLAVEVQAGNLSRSGSNVLFVTSDPVLPQRYQGPCFGRVVLALSSFARQAPDAGQSCTFDFIPPGQRMLWRAVPIDETLGNDQENLCFVGTKFPARPGATTHLIIGKDTGVLVGAVHPTPSAPLNSLMGLLRFTHPGASAAEERWLTLNRQGQFRIDDLPAAVTNAELSIFSPPVLLGTASGLKFSSQVSTSAPPVIELEPIEAAMVGDEAPGFATRTLEGYSLKLSGYRGTPVLLEMWSSHCNPAFSSVPFLEIVAKKYGQNGRLAVIGLNFDGNSAVAQRWAARLGMTWPQGLWSDWSTTPLLAAFGARSLPAAFLIDAQGRLVECNLKGPNMLQAVEQLLGSP